MHEEGVGEGVRDVDADEEDEEEEEEDRRDCDS